MGEEDKKERNVAGWKAPYTGEPGLEEDSLLGAEPVQFIDLNKLKPALGDDEPTPPMMKIPVGQHVPTVRDKAAELNVDEIQARLRKSRQQEISKRRVSEQERMAEKEREEIYEAVEQGDKDFVIGIINREFGLTEFRNLGELIYQLSNLLSGGEEHSEAIDLANIGKPAAYTSKIDFEKRFRVGGQSVLVEIHLGNRSNLGKSGGEKTTKLISADIKTDVKSSNVSSDASPDSNGGWLQRIAKRFTGKDTK